MGLTRSSGRILILLLLLSVVQAGAQAVTSLGITYNTTAGNKTVVATPAVNDLIVVIASASGSNRGNADITNVSDNNADGLGSYTFVVQSNGTNTYKTELWIRNSLVGSNTSTTFTGTMANTNGGGLEVFKITSMQRSGSSAVKHSGGNNGAGGAAPSVAYGASSATGNPNIGAVTNSSSPAPILTQPSSWSESRDQGYTTPATSLETAFINSGFTGSTVTWGSNSGTAWESVAAEFDATAPPVSTTGFMFFFP